jgi:hypothetical protein
VAIFSYIWRWVCKRSVRSFAKSRPSNCVQSMSSSSNQQKGDDEYPWMMDPVLTSHGSVSCPLCTCPVFLVVVAIYTKLTPYCIIEIRVNQNVEGLRGGGGGSAPQYLCIKTKIRLYPSWDLNFKVRTEGTVSENLSSLFVVCLFTLKNVSLIWRRPHCRWRAAKFRSILGAQGLWAGRDLYRATPAVTRGFSFSGLIRTAPFSRLFWHTKGCGGPILTRILTSVCLWLNLLSNVFKKCHCKN